MPAKPIRVLVVNDETTLRRSLTVPLTAIGYLVEEAPDGKTAIERVRQQPFHLILLDGGIAGMGGAEMCRRIRPLVPGAGIVMVAVCDELDEKVRALDAGADDYLTQPIVLRELFARLRAVLRRTGFEQPPEGEVLRAGELELDMQQRRLRKSGREIHLSRPSSTCSRTLCNTWTFRSSTPGFCTRSGGPGMDRKSNISDRTYGFCVRRSKRTLRARGTY